jgi:putative iron-regulated protein
MKISLILISLLATANTYAWKVPFKRDTALEKAVIKNYADIAYTNYSDSLVGAKKMQAMINMFVLSSQTRDTTLIEKNFKLAKMEWATSARLPYGQSEIFRFYNGPIDFEFVDDGVTTYLESINFEGVEGLLNAWPLDEAYIDYVEGDANAGIINDTSIEITSDVIVSMNEVNGEKNISAGYHAIEFLLWGQDRNLDGPGQRPASDYMNGIKNVDRRRKYLSISTSTLIDHLTTVTKQWAPANTNFRKEFEGNAFMDNLKSMFTSMISMAGDELKSERIENAFLLEDQEEEHSCFSDMTVHDIATNALGVKNVYYGQYKAYNYTKIIDGPGVDELVEAINPALNEGIRNAFTDVFNSIKVFYVNGELMGEIALAFDVAITTPSEKAKVQAIIGGLDKLDGLLRTAAKELGLTLDI